MLRIQQSVLISRENYHGPDGNEATNEMQICDLTKKKKKTAVILEALLTSRNHAFLHLQMTADHQSHSYPLSPTQLKASPTSLKLG
jgi:hypothetical protein